MTVNNWYNPATHKSQSPNDLPQPTDATDVCALYDQHQHYTRERHVKIAHKRFIEDKLQRCFLYHGTHNFRQHCRHLMEEFRQTKDELTGWKEFSRVDDNVWNARTHFDPPPFGEPLGVRNPPPNKEKKAA